MNIGMIVIVIVIVIVMTVIVMMIVMVIVMMTIVIDMMMIVVVIMMMKIVMMTMMITVRKVITNLSRIFKFNPRSVQYHFSTSTAKYYFELHCSLYITILPSILSQEFII